MGEFNRIFIEQARQFCEEGDDEAILARRFSTTEEQLRKWRTDHPLFADAIDEGVEMANSTVVRSLLTRCKGYRYQKVVPIMYKGTCTGKEVIEEEMPPDVKACQYWLNNRKPDSWSNNQRLEISNVPMVRIKDLTGEYELEAEDELVAQTLIEAPHEE